MSLGQQQEPSALDLLTAAEALLAAYRKSLERQTPEKPEWYDRYSWPFGATNWARAIQSPALRPKLVRAGKSYRLRREDAEAYWSSLKARQRKVAPVEQEDKSPAGLLRSAGFRVGGAK